MKISKTEEKITQQRLDNALDLLNNLGGIWGLGQPTDLSRQLNHYCEYMKFELNERNQQK